MNREQPTWQYCNEPHQLDAFCKTGQFFSESNSDVTTQVYQTPYLVINDAVEIFLRRRTKYAEDMIQLVEI